MGFIVGFKLKEWKEIGNIVENKELLFGEYIETGFEVLLVREMEEFREVLCDSEILFFLRIGGKGERGYGFEQSDGKIGL